MKRIVNANAQDVIYKPCKTCLSTDYDQFDYKVIEETKDGKFIFEPEQCDLCNFELAVSDSNLLH